MAITKIHKNALPDPLDLTSVDLQIGNDEIVTANIADTNVTHAKLHTDMDLSGKTVTLPTLNQEISVNGVALTQSSALSSPGISYYTNGWVYIRGGTSGSIISDDNGQNTIQVGEGYLRFETGDGSTRMYINGSGNVGIDETNPSHRLHINGGSNDEARVRVTNTANGQASLDLDNSEGYFRTYTDEGEYRIYDQTDGIHRLVIDTAGNVGIGTANPTVLLHAQSDTTSIARFQGSNEGNLYITNDADYVMTLQSSTSSSIAFNTSGSNERIRIHSEGYTELKSSDAYNQLVLTPSGTNAPASINFNTPGTGRAKLKVQNNEYISILSNGNVTVNKAAFPSLPEASKLNIFGDGITLRLDGSSQTTKTILFRNTSSTNPGEVYADGSLRLRTEDPNTNITFHTNSDGSNNERMRIDSSGNAHLKINGENTGQLRLEGRVHRVSAGRWYGLFQSKYDAGSTTSNVLRYNAWYWGDMGVIVEVLQRIYTGFHYGRFRLYGHTNYSNASVGVETLENTGVPTPYFSSIVNQTNDGSNTPGYADLRFGTSGYKTYYYHVHSHSQILELNSTASNFSWSQNRIWLYPNNTIV